MSVGCGTILSYFFSGDDLSHRLFPLWCQTSRSSRVSRRGAGGSRGEVSNALIVLPELVDIAATYYDFDSWKENDPSFHLHLIGLSKRFGVVFVAGTRIPCDIQGITRYYNGSLLITSGGMQELHRKNADGVPQHDVVPYIGLLATNPKIVENVAIGSIICGDLDLPICYGESLFGCDTIFTKFAKISAQSQRPKIVAIPSFMKQDVFELSTPGGPNEGKWRGYYIVLANSRSDPDGHESFIATPEGDFVRTSEGRKNELSTYLIAELDWRKSRS
jgi:predicted amidohydrolase